MDFLYIGAEKGDLKMIDTAKLRWGLRSVEQADYLAVWGARATFAEGELYFMPQSPAKFGCINHFQISFFSSNIQKIHLFGESDQ